MYTTLLKYGQLGAFLVGLVVVVLYLVSVFSGIDTFNGLSTEEQGTTSIFNMGLYATIGLLVICIAVAILFAIYQVVIDPKNAIKGLIGLGVLLGIIFIIFAMTTPEATGPVANTAEEFDVSNTQSKLISAGLWTIILLGGIAILAIVVSEIRNFFK